MLRSSSGSRGDDPVVTVAHQLRDKQTNATERKKIERLESAQTRRAGEGERAGRLQTKVERGRGSQKNGETEVKRRLEGGRERSMLTGDRREREREREDEDGDLLIST